MGEVLRCLAIQNCCAAGRLFTRCFLPYGQVGVDVPNGVEAAVHGLRQYINEFGCRENFLLLENRFQECI